LQSNLRDAKSGRTAAEGKQRSAEKERDETKTKLDETEGTLKKSQEDLTNARGELQNLKTDYEKAKADVDEKSRKIAEMDAILNKPGSPTQTITPEAIKELSDAKLRLETELAEAKQVQETLRSKAEEAGGDLGGYLKEQRESARLSLRQLASMAGVSNPYLSQIERGLRKPSAEVLQQIAKGLQISAEALFLRAGLLEESRGLEVEVALQSDVNLTARQKRVLLDIYATFRAENARATVAGGEEPAGGDVRELKPGLVPLKSGFVDVDGADDEGVAATRSARKRVTGTTHSAKTVAIADGPAPNSPTSNTTNLSDGASRIGRTSRTG
jgi:transcriptional regulator with XRE-family HTH domain